MSLINSYYNSARDEILLRIKQRDAVFGGYLIFVGVILGLIFKNDTNNNHSLDDLFLVIPFLGAATSVMLGQHHMVIGRIARYLNHEFVDQLNDNDPKIHWDNSESLKTALKFGTISRTFIHIFSILISSSWSLFHNFHLFQNWQSLPSILWYLGAILTIFSVAFLIISEYVRRDREPTGNKIIDL